MLTKFTVLQSMHALMFLYEEMKDVAHILSQTSHVSFFFSFFSKICFEHNVFYCTYFLVLNSHFLSDDCPDNF